MKCIKCGHDSKYKDRQDRRCPSCREPFAFEPKDHDKLTDVAFQHAIDAVSSQGNLKWGVEHLYYEICRRLRPRAHYIRDGVIGAGAVGATLVLHWAPPISAGAALFTAWRIFGSWQGRRQMFVHEEQAAFDQMWKRWVAAHGQPPGVIARREQPESTRAAAPELADYSFDRAVICDRARTVDLLLANNFHFENNCAVLSLEGYPRGPFETVRGMLKRNPRLRVLALHDATPAGCRMAAKLSTDSEWFKDQVPVVDVGLRPRHARPFRGLLLPSTGDFVGAGDGIEANETAWLSQYRLEVAAIRPEQVLKRLFRAMNADTAGGDGGDGGGGSGSSYVVYDDDSFSADAGASDGGADSFG